MTKNSVEHHTAIYWALSRQLQQNQWNELATAVVTGLLSSTHERVRLRACELWYRVTANDVVEPSPA